jgi:cytochrome oxidase Cu insertion factor (SCO1/SenC/PrrC family)
MNPRKPVLRATLLRLSAFLWILAALAVFHGPSALAVEVGDPAPDFRLKSTTGKPIALSDYRGKKVVVVQFYVLDFTPG